MALQPWQQEVLDSLGEELPPLTSDQVRAVASALFFKIPEDPRSDPFVYSAFSALMLDDELRNARLYTLGRLSCRVDEVAAQHAHAADQNSDTGESPIPGHPDLQDLVQGLGDLDDFPELARHHALTQGALHTALQRLAATAGAAELSLLVQTYSILTRIEEGMADDTDLQEGP